MAVVILMATTLVGVTGITGCGTDGDRTVASAGPTAGSPNAGPADPATRGAAPTGSRAADATREAGAEGRPSDVVTGAAEPAPGAIADSSARTVMAAWTARWKVPLAYDANLHVHSAVVDYPPARGKLYLVTRQPAQGDRVVAVRCGVSYATKAVDDKLLTAIVDDCLAPALQGTEKRAVLSWLSTRNYGRYDHREATSLPRFDLVLQPFRGAFRISVVGRP